MSPGNEQASSPPENNSEIPPPLSQQPMAAKPTTAEQGRKSLSNRILRYRITAIGQLVVIACLVTVAIVFSEKTQRPLIQSLCGAIASLAAIWGIPVLYWIARDLMWLFRGPSRKALINQTRRGKQPDRPETYSGVEPIHRVQHDGVWDLPITQGHTRARLYLVAALPPAASFMEVLRATIFHESPFGTGLMIGSVSAMVLLLWFVIVSRRPTHEWIAQRCESELLRREQYLCLGRLGCYSNEPDIPFVTQSRIAAITSKDSNSLEDRLSLGELPPDSAHVPDLPRRLDTYIHFRIQTQKGHMIWGVRDMEIMNSTLTALLAAITLASLLLATFHLCLEMFPSDLREDSQRTLSIAFAIIPAVAGFIVALGSLLRVELLERIYTTTLRQLEHMERVALELKGRVEANPATDHSRQFKELVFRTESALTDELRAWMLITDRSHALG
jgi:hypothetical protein